MISFLSSFFTAKHKQNRTRSREPWGRLTGTRGEGEGDNGGKKGKGLDKERVQMTHIHGPQCGVNCGSWRRGLDGGGQRGKGGTTVIEQQ